MLVNYISDDQECIKISKVILSSDILALDTEFSRDYGYHPKLSLVQIATKTGCCYILDILSLSSNALVLIRDIFLSDIIKVMHDPKQDLEILINTIDGIIINNVCDVQQAALMIGYEDVPSYKTLVQDFLSINLSKEQQNSNWMQRPLENVQIEYAATDVLYLIDLYQELDRNLGAKKQWFQKEQSKWHLTKYQQYDIIKDALKYSNFIKTEDHAYILAMLLYMRDLIAKSKDIPRHQVLSSRKIDNILASCNVKQPDSVLKYFQEGNALLNRPLQKLAADEKLVVEFPKRSNDTLLKEILCVSAGVWRKKNEVKRRLRKDAVEKSNLTDQILLKIKILAKKLEINPQFIATRDDIEHMIVAPDKSLLDFNKFSSDDWRWEILGKIFADN